MQRLRKMCRSFFRNLERCFLSSLSMIERAVDFGFVEMEDDAALKAIEALDNKEFEGRTLRVNEARPRV